MPIVQATLSECMRVRYKDATLESPLCTRRRLSLEDMDVDEFRSGLPIAGACLCRRRAELTVDMKLTVKGQPNWEFMFAPRRATRERLLRLWHEAQRHVGILNILRLNHAIWQAYHEHGMDEGQFAKTIKHFAAPDSDAQSEYRQFAPIIANLPEDDQRWLAEVAAGKHGESFGAIGAFILDFMDMDIPNGTSLKISADPELG